MVEQQGGRGKGGQGKGRKGELNYGNTLGYVPGAGQGFKVGEFPVVSVLSNVCCQICLAKLCVVSPMLSNLCCQICVVKCVLSNLSCQLCIVKPMLSNLCCQICVVKCVLSNLSCQLCVGNSMLSNLCCLGLYAGCLDLLKNEWVLYSHQPGFYTYMYIYIQN